MDTPKRGPGRPPKSTKPATFPVKIVRGYFPADGGKKIVKGTVVSLPTDEALRTIELGIAERADPLPS